MSVGRGRMWRNRMFKARPGDKCPHFRNKPFVFTDCGDFVKRILCDNPDFVKKVPASQVKRYMNKDLGPDHHLMAAYLSPGDPARGVGTDFHFTRRAPIDSIAKSWSQLKRYNSDDVKAQLVVAQPDYVWVHARGWSPGILMFDASNRLILDPIKADMNYGSVNYSIFCGLFVVRTRMASVTDEHDM